MKIGILGSGDVGKALAAACVSEGHDVMLATRQPDSAKADSLSKELGATVADFDTVAKFGEVLLLCTLWTGTEQAIRSIKPSSVANKIVIDVTNPLDTSNSMPPKLALGHTDSGGEQVQRWLPHSRIVKALNTVGNQLMYQPKITSGTPTMLYCGNDAEAKDVVRTLLMSFGWEPVDLGDITASRELEPICIAWVKYGLATNSWSHVVTFAASEE